MVVDLFWSDTQETVTLGQFIGEEALIVTAPNTLSALSRVPDGFVFTLTVEGRPFYPIAPDPAFTFDGKTITWISTIYSLAVGNEVIAFYSSGGIDGLESGGGGGGGGTGPAGPPGPAGPAGATGPQGPAGPTGATGSAGSPGASGATGATGPAGPNSVTAGTTTTSGFTAGQILTSDGALVQASSVVQALAVNLVRQAVTASSATLSINQSRGENVALSLGATVTSFSVTNWPASGVTGKLRLVIASTGAFNITGWPAGTIWPGGTAPTITSRLGQERHHPADDRRRRDDDLRLGRRIGLSMSERLTNQQLRVCAETRQDSPGAMATELLALRARVKELEAALKSIWEQDDGGMGRIARAALKDAPNG